MGATGTVTGSKYMITTKTARTLVDCGLFQGLKQLRLRNWNPPPFKPQVLGAVVGNVDKIAVKLLSEVGKIGAETIKTGTDQIDKATKGVKGLKGLFK